MPPLQYYKDNTDWQEFFPYETFAMWINAHVREEWITACGHPCHLDIYEQPQKAPIMVYCHGMSSCGRMMANIAKLFYEKGYTVLLPDLPGFGLSGNGQAFLTLGQMAQALVDVVHWTLKWGAPVFLTGISLGGALSYYAACLGAQVKAIACLNLMDMGSAQTRAVSHRPQVVACLRPLLKAFARWVPNLTIPLQPFVDPSKLCRDDRIVNTFRTNPLVTKHYTLKALNSLLHDSPAIPFERFDRIPILVMHGDQDALIPESLTKTSFEKIPGYKHYVTLPQGEHIPLHPQALSTYIQAVDDWFGPRHFLPS